MHSLCGFSGTPKGQDTTTERHLDSGQRAGHRIGGTAKENAPRKMSEQHSDNACASPDGKLVRQIFRNPNVIHFRSRIPTASSIVHRSLAEFATLFIFAYKRLLAPSLTGRVSSRRLVLLPLSSPSFLQPTQAPFLSSTLALKLSKLFASSTTLYH